METPSPSIASRNWLNALRLVGATGETCRAAKTKREHKVADTQRSQALALEARAWEQLSASREAYLGDAQRDEATDLPEKLEEPSISEPVSGTG